VTKRVRPVWTVNQRTGRRVHVEQAIYDVRYRADGHDFRYGFDQKGMGRGVRPRPAS
jgi:hypothetical protein